LIYTKAIHSIFATRNLKQIAMATTVATTVHCEPYHFRVTQLIQQAPNLYTLTFMWVSV